MSTRVLRLGGERGRVSAGWLDSRHTFSFGHYYDPAWMGFGPLRVINEDRVQPGKGFQTHGHANMEILSFVLEGQLAHADTLGTRIDLSAGDVQCMSAGAGIEHSEFNGSDTESVHFLQVWIQPDRVNATPRHAQARFVPQVAGQWLLVASPEGRDGSLPIRQDANVLRAVVDAGAPLAYTAAAHRKLWVQVTGGSLTVDGTPLQAGDGLGIDGADDTLAFISDTHAELILFDMPS